MHPASKSVHVLDVDDQGAIGYQHLIDLDNIHVDHFICLRTISSSLVTHLINRHHAVLKQAKEMIMTVMPGCGMSDGHCCGLLNVILLA